MGWFLQLDHQVQIWLTVVWGVVAMTLVSHLFGFLKSVFVKPPPSSDDWLVEYVKRMPKVNDGSFHVVTHKVDVKPKPPAGGSGTAPPQKKDSPPLTVTQYYIRRDDGMFYTTAPEMWVPRSEATHWARVEDARRCTSELLAQGIQVRLVDDEVTV